MSTKQLIIVALALLGGSLLGIFFHSLLAVFFSTAIMLLLVLPANTSTKITTPNANLSRKNNSPLDQTGLLLSEVMFDTQKNLASQIAIQSDAVVLLTQAFDSITTLLDEQQHYIHTHLLHKAAIDEASINKMDLWGSQLMDALNNAVRALQFDDMSRQRLEYSITQLHELQPIVRSLGTATQSPSELEIELVRYKSGEQRRKHNPVSATSVASGSIDLF